jgi:large subunit ribosomal protein L28
MCDVCLVAGEQSWNGSSGSADSLSAYSSANMFGTQMLLASLSTPFKRSQFGLFHGKMRQSGNNVPFSKQKTKRTWLPNVQQKRLHSEALGENVRLKLTTRALKTIKKVCFNVCFFTRRFLTGSIPVQYGGLDNYLLSTKTDLLGQEGMRLRVLVREQRNLKVLENAKEMPRAL